MPNLKEYHILISHSWDYSDDYNTIKSWLDDSNCFSWKNYSVPITKPINASSKKDLQDSIRARIMNCSCVIILSGMYVSYSEWIDYEIDTALTYNKPIIGVKPWGQERTPTKVSNCASVMVGWNSNSIVDAVRKYAL